MNLIQKEEFIKITKNVINDIYKDNFDKKYRKKYTIDYYLNLMFELINDINNWHSLSKLNIYKPVLKKDNTLPKYHWKTIQNLFNKWSNDEVFNKSFQNYHNNKIINNNCNDIDLFIDTSFINNKYGIEEIAMNTDNKKKKSTKISIISDNDKFIYSVSYVKINTNNKRKYRKRRKLNKKRRKIIKKRIINKKKIKTKGFVHDVNTIKTSINLINKSYKFLINLIGDKGYISNNKFFFRKKKITLITPKRKNQNKEKVINVKLLKRKVIENTIAIIKKNERIMTRKDHNIKNYMSWIYICCLIQNIKINNKNKK